MINPIAQLNKIFDSRIRLGVMSILAANTNYSFIDLKQILELTDGNLASHLSTLEQVNYIKVNKGFIGRKTNTTYAITPMGKQAFKDHLNTLEILIKQF